MSYVTQAQKDWIRMVYGNHTDHETFQTMLDEFARWVEKNVLPAEQQTEIQRAKNPYKEIRGRFQSDRFDLKNKIEASLTKNKDPFSAEIISALVCDVLDRVAEELKQQEKIPDAVYGGIAGGGLPGISFSEELGGMGFPFTLFVALLEILGKASPSVAIRYAISNTCAEGLRFNREAGSLSEYGEGILKALIAGEKLAAFCLTEGSASGSNIMKEMSTQAVLSPDKTHYILNGTKMWITNAETADVFVVFARTSDHPEQGVSLFLVERGIKGVRMGQIFEKRIVENSSLGEILFNEVKVPLENVVGEIGAGNRYGIRMLNSGRITIAALATGLAQRAFDEYMSIAVGGKKAAGKHLIEYDRTQAKVAEMSMEINAARDMTYRAAWLKGCYDSDPSNPECLREYVIAANGAKLKASLVAQKACDHFVKIGGASSIVKETHSLKHYLDSFLYYFGEAVPEVLEGVISQMEQKKYEKNKGP